MGQGLEPGADCPTVADRLSGRQDDAHQPRSHLSSPLRSGSGSPTPRTFGLLANGARVAGSPGARTQARQELCLAGDHDQSTSRRSGRSRGAGSLGGRPHPRSWQLGDRHVGRAYDALHDAASSSPPRGVWRSSAHEERSCSRGTRGGSRARRNYSHIITLPDELRRSPTWDQGAEMAGHARGLSREGDWAVL